MKQIALLISSLTLSIFLSSWGFYAHKKINETAVFLLPTEMAAFFKKNIKLITEKAVDADKRCYVDTIEGPRHYIDVDRYENIDSIPIHWSKAVEKFTERKLLVQGVVPWQISKTYNNLIRAFKENNEKKIIQYSADLGHYIADAHVPLHTSSNYNGQYSNQIGIHAFWETRLPEMFSNDYNYFIKKAEYIEDPLALSWKIVRESNALVDSVLQIEKTLSQLFKESERKAYIERNNQLIYTYSDAYATQYHKALNGMVERRLRASILQVASFWYSAWIDAGQPKLSNVKVKETDYPSPIETKNKKTLGREEWH
ncbi:zinc dependent phospholipase C family protein [Sphingobacterium faecale]|uniref:Zinc dependent phospholipase C family protein n=1 Tax=Sphingobacterium faecale TaxID=2803775 RepID=A0ABS1R261_9SPHI|nr:zinc dependent phospholipase C family protein [Sphingobacterium faecale]MBL1408782.1 zinc dependent phospholipase C family protein [Sphingobacterium faecale]